MVDKKELYERWYEKHKEQIENKEVEPPKPSWSKKQVGKLKERYNEYERKRAIGKEEKKRMEAIMKEQMKKAYYESRTRGMIEKARKKGRESTLSWYEKMEKAKRRHGRKIRVPRRSTGVIYRGMVGEGYVPAARVKKVTRIKKQRKKDPYANLFSLRRSKDSWI